MSEPGPDALSGMNGVARVPVHQRDISIKAYDLGEMLELVAGLRDHRPWASAGDRPVVHEMSLTLRVDARLTIVDVGVEMGTFPHEECPSIGSAYRGLIGVRIGRGYNNAVAQKLSGPLGCAHLQHLALAAGPAAMQALNSRFARARAEGAPMDAKEFPPRGILNTCHIWADDGPGEAKVAMGWRPGPDQPYPAPRVDRKRTRQDRA